MSIETCLPITEHYIEVRGAPRVYYPFYPHKVGNPKPQWRCIDPRAVILSVMPDPRDLIITVRGARLRVDGLKFKYHTEASMAWRRCPALDEFSQVPEWTFDVLRYRGFGDLL
jgi:hypothetical protein